MPKLIAILNVIAWSGFWALGYLALTADREVGGSMTIAVLLAALGTAVGMWAWLWLVWHSERTGYARPSASRPRHDDDDALTG